MPRGNTGHGTTASGLPRANPVPATSPVVATQSQSPVQLTSSGLPKKVGGHAGTVGGGVSVDPGSWNEYVRLSDDPFLSDPRRTDLSSLQSGGELFKNSVLGAAVNVGAGFMEGLGSWDLSDTFGMAAGANQEFGNWFHDQATALGEYVGQEFPIYEKDPGSFNPGDPAWWGKQGQSLGFTAGFFVEGAAEQIALAYLTGGTANEISAASKIKALTNLTRAGAKAAGKEALWGGFMGIREATTNGYQTYDETYDKYLQLGYSQEESTRLASQAAAKGFRTEAGPLLVMNALQYSTLAHNPVTGKSYSPFLEGIKNKTVKNISNLAINTAGETLEETWQTIAGLEGKHYADVLSGRDDNKSTFGSRLGNYMTNAEVLNSAAGGALGGMMFAGIGGARNKVEALLGANQAEKSWENYKLGLQGLTMDYLQKIKEAEDKGFTGVATSLKNQMSAHTALNSYHIDHLKNDLSRGTYQAHEASLQGILDAAKSGDLETLSKYKIGEADVPFVLEEFPGMIADAKSVTKIYDSLKNTNDASVLVPMAYTQHSIEKLGQEKTEAEMGIKDALNSLVGASDLSTTGRDIVGNRYEQRALQRAEQSVQRMIEDPTQQHGVPLENLQERLKEIKDQLKANETAYNKLAEDLEQLPTAAKDKSIMKSLPHQGDISALSFKAVTTDTSIAAQRAELAKLSDKELQAKTANERINAKMKKATTPEEVDATVAADAAVNNGKPRKWTMNRASKKKKDMAAREAGLQASTEATASVNQTANAANTTPSPDHRQTTPVPPPGEGSGPSTKGTAQNTTSQPTGTTTQTQAQRKAPPPVTKTYAPRGGAKAKPAQPAPVPSEISVVMRAKLKNEGFTPAEIDAMTAEKAHTILQDAAANAKSRESYAEDAEDDPITTLFGAKGDLSEDKKNALKDLDYTDLQEGPVVGVHGPGTIVPDPDTLLSPEYAARDEAAYAEWENTAANRVQRLVDIIAAEKSIEPNEVSFRDFLKEILAYYPKDVVEASFNAYKAGWKKNDFKETNFDREYNAAFGDKMEAINGLINLGVRVEGPSPEELQAEAEELVEATGVSTDPLMFVPLPDGSYTVERTGNKKVEPELSMQFLSVGYHDIEVYNEDTGETTTVRVDDETIYQGEDIDSRDTMDPDKNHVGYESTAVMADNPESIYVRLWDDDYGDHDSVTFGEWLIEMANRGFDVSEGSRLWLSKVPMIIYDDDGTPKGFVPDADSFNPSTVGFEGDVKKMTDLINEGRARIMALRTTLYEHPSQEVRTKVTKRTPGNIVELPKGEFMYLDESDPTAPIGFATTSGVITTSHGNLLPEQLIWKEKEGEHQKLVVGRIYDFRQCGVVEVETSEGMETLPQYMAMKVQEPEVLNEDAYHSVKWAIRAYLAQKDTDGRLMPVQQRNDLQSQIQQMSQLNIYNAKDLRTYLNQFIQTVNSSSAFDADGKLDYNAIAQEAYNKVNGDDRYHIGTPFICIQDGLVIFGVKGQPIQGHSSLYTKPEQAVSSLFLNPFMIEKPQLADRAARRTMEMLSEMDMTGTDPANPRRPISRLRLNVSGRVDENVPVALINAQGEVHNGGRYSDFLRQRLQTNIRGFNIGTAEEPKFATFAQPVIQFTYDGEQEAIAKEMETRKKLMVTGAPQDQIGVVPGGTGKQPGIQPGTQPATKNLVSEKPTYGGADWGWMVSHFDAPSASQPLLLEIAKKHGLMHDTEGSFGFRTEAEAKAFIAEANGYAAPAPEAPAADESAIIEDLNNNEALRNAGIDLSDLLSPGLSSDMLSPAYEKVNNDLVANVKRDITRIEGMELADIAATSNTLAREIEKQIDTKYGASVSKKTVMAAVNEIRDGFIANQIKGFQAAIPQLEALAKTHPKAATKLAEVQYRLGQMEKVRDNWEALAADAMQEVLSSTGIREVNRTIRDFSKDALSAIQELGLTMSDDKLEQLRLAAQGNKENYAQAALIYKDLYYKSQEARDRLEEDVPEDVDSETDSEFALDMDYASLELEEMDMSMDELTAENGGERAQNWSQTSLQENNKGSVSYLFRRFTSQIPEYNPVTKEVVRGFAGLIQYPGYGYYFDRIETLLTDPTDCPSDYGIMLGRLKEHEDRQPWLKDFITRLENSSEQMKNSFVYGMNLHGAKFKFVMIIDGKNGYSVKVYDTNSSQIARVLTDQWYENFKASPLVASDGDHVDLNKAREVVKEYGTWKDKYEGGVPPAEVASAWLENFGIELSADTITELIQSGYKVPTGRTWNPVTWKSLFGDAKKSSVSIFHNLQHSLKETVRKAEDAEKSGKDPAPVLDITDTNSEANPLNNASKAIDRLANIEKRYTTRTSTLSVRDGDKTIYGLTTHSMSSHQALKLKTSAGYRKQLEKVTFNGGSFILQLLKDNTFSSKFDLEEIGINAVKQQGKKNFRDTEITTLSDADQEAFRLGLHNDTKQGTVDATEVTVFNQTYSGLSMRIGRMLFPTMGDKSRMKATSTALLNFRKGTELLAVGEDGMRLSDKMLGFAFSQLVEPELRRMLEHHQTAIKQKKHPNEVTNIQDYNMAAQIFLGMPQMNFVTYKGIPLPAYIANNAGTIDAKQLSQIIVDIKGQTNDLLQAYFAEKVNDKVKKGGVWEPFIKRDRDGKVSAITHIDAGYLKSLDEDTNEKSLTHAAYEYVFNSHIHMANNMMLFGMDLAYFSKDKAFATPAGEDERFETSDDGSRILPYYPKDPKYLLSAIQNTVDANLGKRLAMLMTPGKALSNSTDEKYIQLCLADRTSVSDNMEYLINLFYGDGTSNKVPAMVEQLLKTVRGPEGKEVKDARRKLQELYPKIADYFKIESTDAQEYVTVKEAADILYRQGRLTEADHGTITSKAASGQELTVMEQEQIKQIVLQPSKPVYAGIVHGDENGMNLATPIYVKSSAIPLIPRQGGSFELDKLRQAMEAVQAKTGLNVRASYASANKVGNVNEANQLKIWDHNGNFIDGSINADEIAQQNATIPVNFLKLDRGNFKVQQDVPYKSDKRSEDTVSMVTQAMKTLFGDGVLDIQDPIFELNGRPATAHEMYKHYVHHFGNLVSAEKTKLYKEIGINPNTGKPYDEKRTARKVQSILRREALDRKYPTSSVEGLTLEDDNAFTLPVWLAPDSNKYENLLNSMVTNRIVRLKFPGCQLVAASQEGFQFEHLEDEGEAAILKKYPGMVFTNKWTGSLQAAKYDENGNFQTAQAFLQSKFRTPDGKIIDLVKDGYTKVVDGKLMLDMDKMDPELLSVSSFRIPLSGHVSMSQLEIVGFLPPEVGDIIIVPKNMTKQKGMDYDVDKENLYQLWHTVDAQGRLAVASRQNMNDTQATRKKLDQNEVVKVFHAFLRNGSPEVQRRINKVLSLKFEQEQRDLFLDYTQDVNTNFSIYDDEHQKAKMALGAAGKSGIAVYANMMVMHNMIQQNVDREGKLNEMRLMVPATPYAEEYPFQFTLGGMPCDGVLGKTSTLDGTRSVSDVVAGRLGIATDNEKEQIMGVVGINDLTIGVDGLLTMLGYDQTTFRDDMGTTHEVSIPFLFLSQPIIKDYVARMKELKGVTAGFNVDVKNKVIKQLVAKYSIDPKATKPLEGYKKNEVQSTYSRLLTPENLFNHLKRDSDATRTSDSETQQAVLDLFIKLESYAREMTKVQNRISIQREGVGKSIPEMLLKYDNVASMSSSNRITNIAGLVGDFLTKYTPEEREQRLLEGYIPFQAPGPGGGEFLVKPTTTTGHTVLHAVKAGKDLWADYFPYHHRPVRSVLNRIMTHISSADDTEATRITKQMDIMEDMRKYLFSDPAMGLFHGDPQQDRYRLFVDNTNPAHPNTSLATYLKALERVDSDSARLVATNKLISQFTYEINKNNSARNYLVRGAEAERETPSLTNPLKISFFNYNNSKGADIGDEYKYGALVELMAANQTIKNAKDEPILFNGREYTTRMLAADLITATYLKGGIQKATEIVKYIPVPYLRAIGFAGAARKLQAAAKDATKGAPDMIDISSYESQERWSYMLGEPVADEGTSSVWRFERQYIQHNPTMVAAVPSDIKNVAGAQSFRFSPKEKETAPRFMHFKAGKGNVLLFEQIEDTDTYRRIPTLSTGDTGLSSEYSVYTDMVTSMVNVNPIGQIYTAPTYAPPTHSAADITREGTFALDTGNLSHILQNIQQSSSGFYSVLAKELLPFVRNDVSITVAEIAADANGSYNEFKKQITIGRGFLEKTETTQDDIARTILHEYIHSITARELDKYFNPDGTFKPGVTEGNLPAHMSKLSRAFKQVAKGFTQGELDQFASRFGFEKVLTSERDKLLYGGYDIREMLSMLSDPDFREALSKVTVDSSGTTLLKRIADALLKILEAAGLKPGTLASEAFEALLSVAHAQQESIADEKARAKQATLDVQKELNKAQAEMDMANSRNAQDGDHGEAPTGPAMGSLLPQIRSEVNSVLAEIDQC